MWAGDLVFVPSTQITNRIGELLIRHTSTLKQKDWSMPVIKFEGKRQGTNCQQTGLGLAICLRFVCSLKEPSQRFDFEYLNFKESYSFTVSECWIK